MRNNSLNKHQPNHKFTFVAAMTILLKPDRGYGPKDISSDCERLFRIAKRLHKLNENDCNFGLNLSEMNERPNLEQMTRSIISNYDDVTVEFNYDPRGNAVFFKCKLLPSVDIGGRGFGI